MLLASFPFSMMFLFFDLDFGPHVLLLWPGWWHLLQLPLEPILVTFVAFFCFTRFPSSLLFWPTWHLHIGWRLRLAGISWPLLHSLHWHHAMIICLVVVFNWIVVSYVIFRCFWAEKNYSDGMSTRDTRQLPISARTSSSLYINSEPLVPLCHLKAIISIPNCRAFLCKINILVKFL